MSAETPDNLYNLAVDHYHRRELAEAERCFNASLAIRPAHPQTIFARSLVYMMQGDLARCWPGYECRPDNLTMLAAEDAPRWDGAADPYTRVFLRSDQGLGDQLQFIRYALLVRERVGWVAFGCERRLIPLLRGCHGIDEFAAIDDGEKAIVHCQCPLSSLPFILGTTLDTIPARVPYITADPSRVKVWRQRLAGSRFIGIAWQGNQKHRDDCHRSIPLAAFAPLAKIHGVRLLSLQHQRHDDQISQAGFPVDQFSDPIDQSGAFIDTAAIMHSLDLVIAADTAIAHLAGAMGLPVWVALSARADPRWMLDRSDSPWYPSVRLFRQEKLGEWGPVFERMAAALTNRTAAQS